MEAVRRGPGGVWAARGVLAAFGAIAGLVVATGSGPDVVEALHARLVIDAAVDGGLLWPLVLVVVLAITAATVLAGIPVARIALRRPSRQEERLDAGHHRVREIPTGPADTWGDLRMLVRVDRNAVLRSLPLRRGLLVLTLLPGLGGLVTGVEWSFVILLPGLIASGVTLLCGVNAWALDGRGALWRESLPVDPALVFAARSVVLAGMAGGAAVVGTVLAGLRADTPTPSIVSALVCFTVVVLLQTVATSARWSVRNPHTADLTSARAVPAPPVTMLGYSSRLALSTTCTGMVFQALAGIDAWRASPIIAVPFLVWSTVRLLRARRAWCTAATRSFVVTTVAA
jgi:hypothetical protein